MIRYLFLGMMIAGASLHADNLMIQYVHEIPDVLTFSTNSEQLALDQLDDITWDDETGSYKAFFTLKSTKETPIKVFVEVADNDKERFQVTNTHEVEETESGEFKHTFGITFKAIEDNGLAINMDKPQILFVTIETR